MSASSGLPPTLVGTGDLFQLLRDGTPRTRGELAQLSSLARSTITARVEAMLSSGLLEPVGEAASTGGRPPTRFALNRRDRVVLAIDLGASHASVAVSDLSGQVLDERTVVSDIADGPVVVLDRAAAIGVELLAGLGRLPADVAGVGIGVPGPVEHAKGRPANPPIMPGWHDFDVPEHFGRHFSGPILVDNDVNLMALGEYVTSWHSTPHLLLVKVATGIGAGIVTDGRLLRGALGSAGDLGHVQVAGAPADVVCRCGNTGCLEAVAAGPAIAAKLRAKGLDVESSQQIVDAVSAGDIAALQAVREAGRDLGSVLATCVNLLNPSVIVIGGKLSEAGEYLLAGVREVVYQRSLPLATHNLRIVGTSAGSRGAILGASAMVIDAVLAPGAVDEYVAARIA
ncbi:ROK family transcriptional regulator [Aeromicrobium chenweiae]|uniref:Sugar kinase n=1 Tax=Aeromicrobium chenweiae TaxID=2079793 RepID=A0A2S0WRY1_9ACTN|nr:ROK family transcriptional regulator [Aeromicrobium chenweiae]AWB94038.1 sugar kinase [Aeromicrobium chenweiae]TGN32407.1 ROK family transcriptional regulator [Aeromicrobium chenweiae]